MEGGIGQDFPNTFFCRHCLFPQISYYGTVAVFWSNNEASKKNSTFTNLLHNIHVKSSNIQSTT